VKFLPRSTAWLSQEGCPLASQKTDQLMPYAPHRHRFTRTKSKRQRKTGTPDQPDVPLCASLSSRIYLAAYLPCQSCWRRNGIDFFQYMRPKNIWIVCRKGTGTCIISASARLYPTRRSHRFRLVHRKKFRLPVTRGEALSLADPRRYETGERPLIYSVTVCSCCPPYHLPDRRYCLPLLKVSSSGPSEARFQRRWRCRSKPLCRS
jgi:hypothetical protein